MPADQRWQQVLAPLLGPAETFQAAAPCRLYASTTFVPLLGDQENTGAAQRARHAAGPQTAAGSYPDVGVASPNLLVITDVRLLSCPLERRVGGGRPWLAPIITERTWQVARLRLVMATVIRPRLPVVMPSALRLQFDDGSVLDLEVVPRSFLTTRRRDLKRLVTALRPTPGSDAGH